MKQKVSGEEPAARSYSPHTEAFIDQELNAASSKRITLNPRYLDDESLTDAERIEVINEVFHRNIRSKQLEGLARYLAPVLGRSVPSNLLIYGVSGTGKSVTCLHFLSVLQKMCARRGVPFRFVYLDLTAPRTCFSALNELVIALDANSRRYRKGIPVAWMQETIIKALNRYEGFICILADEVDNVKGDANALYTFLAKTLPRKVQPRLVYVFLTNRLQWDQKLDPRILAVLKKTDIIFEPYNAEDLVQILQLRVEKALDKSKVDTGAIRKIAALASRENGDARKAVELLVKAVAVAEETSGLLGVEEVDQAQKLLEVEKSEEMIASLASQQKLVLQACYLGLKRQSKGGWSRVRYTSFTGCCASRVGVGPWSSAVSPTSSASWTSTA